MQNNANRKHFPNMDYFVSKQSNRGWQQLALAMSVISVSIDQSLAALQQRSSVCILSTSRMWRILLEEGSILPMMYG